MEEIKNTLGYWEDNKEEFDPKLVAREETGCCVYDANGTKSEDGPCNQ